ncbi:ATP-dependent DNA helicase pif1-like [Leptopilina boulardi]|uniref:ATP-dependent DNA helicase pif1-like n=1 Tax=Leptopilina boulardi TaxID=63433 RepID=UPI0021F53239|nr:ATP-dependent DNA helicase pif1-like [Leptopilina boulardi]
MAFTGIAATLLPNRKTVHKTLGLPVPLFSDSTSSIKVQSKEGQYLKNVDIFILDEAPMAPRFALEVMDRTLRDIMKNDIAFGGKIVVLGGNFRQLLPIKENETKTEIINLNGTLNDANDNVKIPKQIIANVNSDIVNDIYGKLIRDKKFDEISECAILSARNADVNELNERVVQLLDTTTERIYTSIDTVENNDSNSFNEIILPEYLNSLSPPSLLLHELRLRVNSIIMLIRNLRINKGLCNGTRLLVLELTDNLLRCKILTGDKFGDIVFINRITLYCENVNPFTFKRRQFPVKLAFAMTINKSQGQTFTNIGIDLRKDVFNRGQLYVACSRVRK